MTTATLHAYQVGPDVVIARDAADALAYTVGSSGYDPDEIDGDIYQLPDDQELTIDDDGERATKTIAEWIAYYGRGLLYSEWY